MDKTEEKRNFADKILEWEKNNLKKIWIICSILFFIGLVCTYILMVIDSGGFKAHYKDLFIYPEQKYEQLEKEVQNVIVEGKGIYPERLSRDDINYEITYEQSTFEGGYYTITLTDYISVTATVDKKYNKDSIKIDRDLKTKSDYIVSNALAELLIIVYVPLVIILLLLIFINLPLMIISLINELYKYFISKISKNQ